MTRSGRPNHARELFSRATAMLALVALVVAIAPVAALASAPSAGGATGIPASASATAVKASADTTPPTTFSDWLEAYDGTAVIHLFADDNGGSGVATTYYVLDGGQQTVYSADTPITTSVGGTHSLTFWSVDNANNEGQHIAVTFIVQVPDVIAPTTTSDAVATYTTSAAIHLSALDNDGGSGVQATYYKLDSAASYSVGNVVTISTAGSHTLMFYSADYDGNAEAAHSVAFYVSGPATVRLSKNPGGTKYTITLRNGAASFAYSARLETLAGASCGMGKTAQLMKSSDGVTWGRVRGAAQTTDANGWVRVNLVFKTRGSSYWKWFFDGDSQYKATSTSKSLIVVK